MSCGCLQRVFGYAPVQNPQQEGEEEEVDQGIFACCAVYANAQQAFQQFAAKYPREGAPRQVIEEDVGSEASPSPAFN